MSRSLPKTELLFRSIIHDHHTGSPVKIGIELLPPGTGPVGTLGSGFRSISFLELNIEWSAHSETSEIDVFDLHVLSI